MKLNSLKELYVEQLKDLYNAENQILKALPKMAEMASHSELQQVFKDHEKETQRQVERLEKIFKNLDYSPTGEKCKGMEGLLEEGKDMMSKDGDSDVIDAGLIAAAQRVEHYEIAGYGCVRTYAEMLGENEAARLLQETLDEEHSADDKLNRIAMDVVNVDAEAHHS